MKSYVLSFKPYYNWNTFNTDEIKEEAKAAVAF